MTTKELISELQRLDPTGNAKVFVSVGSYTSAYPHDYIEPHCVERYHKNVRLAVNLSKGFIVSRRKAATSTH